MLDVKGTEIFNSEVKSIERIPSDQRFFYMNYKMNDEGETEPISNN